MLNAVLLSIKLSPCFLPSPVASDVLLNGEHCLGLSIPLELLLLIYEASHVHYSGHFRAQFIMNLVFVLDRLVDLLAVGSSRGRLPDRHFIRGVIAVHAILVVIFFRNVQVI